MNTDFYIQIIVVFAVSLVGGWLALARKWSDSLLHLFVSLGAGIILGVVFLHLLPESMHGGGKSAALPILLGFLIIFFLERILLGGGQPGYDHDHKVISITVFLGLSVHSLFEGVGLAIGNASQQSGQSIFLSIVAHKIPAAFALGSLLVLGRLNRRRIWSMLIIFALSAPVGALVFSPVLAAANADLLRMLTGLTAGTFLYIATGDLLPEVFHTREKRWLKLILLLLGVLFAVFLGDDH